MADILWVVGAIVVLVTALLVVDWFTAGRTKRRLLVRAKDQQVGNANVDYTVIQRIGQGLDNQSGGGI